MVRAGEAQWPPDAMSRDTCGFVVSTRWVGGHIKRVRCGGPTLERELRQAKLLSVYGDLPYLVHRTDQGVEGSPV